MDDSQVAQTTLAQLGGTGRLSAMIGATHFAYDAQGELSFKFKGSKRWNYAKITLDGGTDTYTVEFAKITMGRNYRVNRGEPHSLVTADALRTLFENETSLRLSL